MLCPHTHSHKYHIFALLPFSIPTIFSVVLDFGLSSDTPWPLFSHPLLSWLLLSLVCSLVVSQMAPYPLYKSTTFYLVPGQKLCTIKGIGYHLRRSLCLAPVAASFLTCWHFLSFPFCSHLPASAGWTGVSALSNGGVMEATQGLNGSMLANQAGMGATGYPTHW